MEGPANDSPDQVWGDPLNFCPRPPERPQKSFPPIFQKSKERGPIFRVRYTGTPMPVRDKILATVPWPTSAEKNFENRKFGFF